MPREPHPRGRIGRHPAVTRNHRGSSPREGAKQGDSPAWTKARASGARERGFESLSPYHAGVAQPQVEHASPKRGDGGSSPSAGAIFHLSQERCCRGGRSSTAERPAVTRAVSVRFRPITPAQCSMHRACRRSSAVRASGFEPDGRGFESSRRRQPTHQQEVCTISTKYDHNRFRGDE